MFHVPIRRQSASEKDAVVRESNGCYFKVVVQEASGEKFANYYPTEGRADDFKQAVEAKLKGARAEKKRMCQTTLFAKK